MFPVILVLTLLLAAPALAQSASDSRTCDRLAETMDAALAAGMGRNKSEEAQFDVCIAQFSCPKSREIANRNATPDWAVKTNVGTLRWLRQTCGQAAAPQQVNTHDAASCLDYAGQMDAKAKSGGKFTQQENNSLTECVQNFTCPAFYAAKDAGQIPDDAVATNTNAIRYTLKTCGYKEPPKPVPGSAFGEQPKSKF